MAWYDDEWQGAKDMALAQLLSVDVFEGPFPCGSDAAGWLEIALLH